MIRLPPRSPLVPYTALFRSFTASFARLGLHRFRFRDLSSLVRRHLLKLRFELLSLLTLLLQGGPNLLQFRSVSKNAPNQFLALLLLLSERFAQSGSLSRHGLQLLIQLFVGPRLRGIGFPNSRCRSRRSCESPRQVINALLAGHHRLGRRHFLQLLFQPLSLLTLLFQLDSGAFQIFGRLPQAGFRCCAVLLGFGSRLLRQRQLAAEFVALLLQTGQFLSNIPRAFFKASRLRGIPLFARLALHRFRFHDLSSLVRRHLLKARFELLSLLTLLLQLGPNLLQIFAGRT